MKARDLIERAHQLIKENPEKDVEIIVRADDVCEHDGLAVSMTGSVSVEPYLQAGDRFYLGDDEIENFYEEEVENGRPVGGKTEKKVIAIRLGWVL